MAIDVGALPVEDNPSDADLTRRTFGECGIAIELAVAEDGAESSGYLSCTGAYAGRDVKPVGFTHFQLVGNQPHPAAKGRAME